MRRRVAILLLLGFGSPVAGQLCPPVENLQCDLDCVTGAPVLFWNVPFAYDQLEIQRDGVPIVTLPGDSTEFVDFDAVEGERLYSVSPICGPVTGPPTVCRPPGHAAEIFR